MWKEYKNRLVEAQEALVSKGIYPIDLFLHEQTETLEVAESIERLEESVNRFQKQIPTIFYLVSETGRNLSESRRNPELVESTLLNYAFISEAVGKMVGEAVKLLQIKHSPKQSLQEAYGKDSQKLLEFCIVKANSHAFLVGSEQLVSMIAEELSKMTLHDLGVLCESMPTMKLYVSMKTHKELAKTVLSS